jgi:hypothetical protein
MARHGSMKVGTIRTPRRYNVEAGSPAIRRGRTGSIRSGSTQKQMIRGAPVLDGIALATVFAQQEPRACGPSATSVRYG